MLTYSRRNDKTFNYLKYFTHMVNYLAERTQHCTMALQFNDIDEIIGFEIVTYPTRSAFP